MGTKEVKSMVDKEGGAMLTELEKLICLGVLEMEEDDVKLRVALQDYYGSLPFEAITHFDKLDWLLVEKVLHPESVRMMAKMATRILQDELRTVTTLYVAQ